MGAERKYRPKTLVFIGNATTIKFEVEILLSRNFVVIAQAPIFPQQFQHLEVLKSIFDLAIIAFDAFELVVSSYEHCLGEIERRSLDSLM